MGGGMQRAFANRSLLHPDRLSHHSCPSTAIPTLPSVIPAQAGSERVRRLLSQAQTPAARLRNARDVGACRGHGRRVGSCLRRNDGGGRRNEGGGVARTICGVGSVRRTPHLTSPLEGGRDELGEGMGASGGSCLRRNDGRGAGMTGVWMRSGGARAPARSLVDARCAAPPT